MDTFMDCTYVYNVCVTIESLLGFRNYLKIDKISITLIRNRHVLRYFVCNIALKDYSVNVECFMRFYSTYVRRLIWVENPPN